MPSCFDAFLHSQGFVLLDGGLASELERAGHDLNDPLWSAKILLEDPAAIEAVHASYLRAGADCVITATYQATFQGLAARGVTRSQAEAVFRRAVDLAVRARDRFEAHEASRTARTRPLVAASIGPYGALLADGSEYHGDYGVGAAALADFHGPRLRLLADTPADILACETIPSFTEARALAALVADSTDKPAWFTFTCRDECHISDGTPIAEAAAWADEAAGVHAVGVNCTPARLLPPIIRTLAAATTKPVVAYPNGGGEWHADTKTWGRADDEPEWAGACRDWVAAGAVAVGGCCRVGPEAICGMRAALLVPGPREPHTTA
ncbi:MAG: homocysteine S-methyltransferase [Gemmatimonadetes bacterium]|nr:homocysteine S-methyltransferase [Gemmatimonadota bacterium]